MSYRYPTHARWDNYLLNRGEEFHRFWKKYLTAEKRDILFVLGRGFDPRMCDGLKAISEAGGLGRRDCLLVDFDEGPTSPSARHKDLFEKNQKTLSELFPNGSKTPKKVSIWSEDGRRIGSREAANIFMNVSDFSAYSDVIIDVSAMPRGIYFPLIGKILYLVDSSPSVNCAGDNPNFHVIVSENAQLDSGIHDEEIDEHAGYMHGFTGALNTEAASGAPKVWIPLLGEKKGVQLERIYDFMNPAPDEVCPMLPMPSVNPRRTDNLLIEYREFLFDQLILDPRNFIYASEQNPFEVYHQILQTVVHYNQALSPLGGCQVIISALSSKLLSIGALLAAYELKDQKPGVGIVHIEAKGYHLENSVNTEKVLSRNELSTLWLAGECYDR